MNHIHTQISQYEVETRGVYIQDVILPQELVQVLTQREIANQEKATYQMQQEAKRLRIDMEKAKGTADMQAQLAQAQVGVEIATQTAQARKKQADGEATYIAETGHAEHPANNYSQRSPENLICLIQIPNPIKLDIVLGV